MQRLGLSNYSASGVQEAYDCCKKNGYVLPSVYHVRKRVRSRGSPYSGRHRYTTASYFATCWKTRYCPLYASWVSPSMLTHHWLVASSRRRPKSRLSRVLRGRMLPVASRAPISWARCTLSSELLRQDPPLGIDKIPPGSISHRIWLLWLNGSRSQPKLNARSLILRCELDGLFSDMLSCSYTILSLDEGSQCPQGTAW
jgi:hypothetical protein